MPVVPGLSGSVCHVVEPSDTAVALGSGDLPVLGTPRALAWLEEATVRVVAQHLEPGQTSVGTRVVMAHRRPSVVGTPLTAHARVVDVAGTRLTFEVRLVDEAGQPVAEGTVARSVVDAAAFAQRAG